VLLALSPDGTRLAVPLGVQDDKSRFGLRVDRVKIWDLDQRKELLTFELQPRADSHLVVFSPDGKRLATTPLNFSDPAPSTSGAGGVVHVLDATTGAEILTLNSAARSFTILAFSLDGTLLAAGSLPEEAETGLSVVEVWDLSTGQRRHTLRGHAGRIEAIAFSPDGSRIVTSTPASTINESGVKVWDAATGKELTTLTCRGLISGLAFQSDGLQLIGARSMSALSDPAQANLGRHAATEGTGTSDREALTRVRKGETSHRRKTATRASSHVS